MIGDTRWGRGQPASGWRDPAVALYVAYVIVGLVQTAVHDPATTILRATLPAAASALTVVAVRCTEGDVDEARGRRWLLMLGTAGAFVAASAIVAFVRAVPAGVGPTDGFYRVKVLVTTPVGDHNTAAAVLLVAVVAAVTIAAHDRRWWVGAGLCTLGLVATLSRGATVVLLLVGLSAGLVGARREVVLGLRLAGLSAFGLVTGLAAWLGASPPSGARVPDGPIGTSIVGRLDLVLRGVEVGVENPWLGIGLGRFAVAADDLPFPNTHAHNAWVNAFAEGGTVLLAIVVALTVLLAVRAWRQPRGWRRDLTLLGGAALVAHSQIDIVGGLAGPEVVMATLLGLARGRPGAVTGGEPVDP